MVEIGLWPRSPSPRRTGAFLRADAARGTASMLATSSRTRPCPLSTIKLHATVLGHAIAQPVPLRFSLMARRYRPNNPLMRTAALIEYP